MSRKQRIKLVAAGAVTLANALALHKGIQSREQERDYRTPFDSEWYSNRYNH